MRLKSNLSKFFTLTWKKTAIALIIWIFAVFIHNAVYAFFDYLFSMKIEEPVFSSISIVIIPMYFLLSVLYTLYKISRN